MARHHIYAIQASVLLAYYFFVAGRPVEGQYHSNSAVTLALSMGLHCVAANNAQDLGPLAGQPLLALAPALDAMELGERIRLFLQAYFLDHCWSVTHGVPCARVDAASEVLNVNAMG